MRTNMRSAVERTIIGAIIFYGVILLLLGVGWVKNIIDLLGTSFDPLTGLAVARVVGVFLVPLGSVLGYFS